MVMCEMFVLLSQMVMSGLWNKKRMLTELE